MHCEVNMTPNARQYIFRDNQKRSKVPLMFSVVKLLP